MDFSQRLAISYYNMVAVINESHKIFLVQHKETKKIYVKKILDVYNLNVYECLYTNHIIGTPKIIAYHEEDGQLTVIEEYISGDSLSEKISRSELSPDDIQRYMLDLCNILEKLHAINPPIIHRDIKPSNIIINNYNNAVLLDFNAAKYYSKQATEDTILLGTQGYAAPEQYGFGSSSPQTDIYSLGIILKEMLSSIGASTPQFDKIINRCTMINPSERYSTVSELKKDLLLYSKSASSSLSAGDYRRFLPPGFRSKTPWKMLISTPIYLFILWLSFTIEIKDTYGFALWLERSFILAMFLFVICGCFNYLDVQRCMPLCKHPKRLVRYFGIFVLNATVVFALLTTLLIIESILLNP